MDINKATDILKASLECIERDTSGDFELCNNDCDNCHLSYEQGTAEDRRKALAIALEYLQMISEDDILNQFKLYTTIYKLMLNLNNVNFLKLISATALELVKGYEEREKILVDDTEYYKFDDTKRYDD